MDSQQRASRHESACGARSLSPAPDRRDCEPLPLHLRRSSENESEYRAGSSNQTWRSDYAN